MTKTWRWFISAIAGIMIAPSLTPASAFQLPPAAEPPAIAQFHKAIAEYMALRNKLRSEVRGPVKDSSSSQVTDASDALAGAIQRSRRGARAGSMFSEPVAVILKQRIADAVRRGKLAPVLADIDDEGTSGPAPKVHLRLPVTAQMATMPPSLLEVLPVLPKELEYRIVGRYLILRDVDASLILDFIPAAVSR